MRGFGGIFGNPLAGSIAQQIGPRAPNVAQQPAKGDKTKRIIGIIGDALLGLGGQQGVYAPMMAQRRAEERQLQMMEQQRRQGLEDYRYKKLVDYQFEQPKGPEIGIFEDNAGNRFRYNKETGLPIGEEPVFIDRNERMFVQDGALVRVPNMFRQGGGMPSVRSREDYDALPPGAQYTDPNGNIRTKGGAASNSGGNFRP